LSLSPTFVDIEIFAMQSKRFFLICSLVLSLAAHSQFKKGMKMIGYTVGTASFNSGNIEYSYPSGTLGYTSNSRSWNLSLAPSMGWFIQDNSVAGGSVTLSFGGQKSWNNATNGNTYKEDNAHSIDYGLGAFFRYYFSTTNTIRPFAHAFINAGSGSSKSDGYYYATNFSQTYTGKITDRFYYNAGLNAGATKMLNSNVGLEIYIGYLHSLTKSTSIINAHNIDNGATTDATYETTQKFNNNGVNLGVGIQVFLDK
jgi:hypothetical protein